MKLPRRSLCTTKKIEIKYQLMLGRGDLIDGNGYGIWSVGLRALNVENVILRALASTTKAQTRNVA